MNLLPTFDKPVIEFYEEPGHLRIETTDNGIKMVRYLEREDAKVMLQYIGLKSTAHRGQLVTV